MPVHIPDKPGSYIIVGELLNESWMNSGPFCGQLLPSGYYFYSGSAFGSGGLRARIGRHLNSGTRKFWHFDHIKEIIKIREIWYSILGLTNLECQFIMKFQSLESASFPILKFGSSDCRFGCPAHLVRYSLEAEVKNIFFRLESNDFSMEKITLI
jgi:Uri superfamily endonuclease